MSILASAAPSTPIGVLGRQVAGPEADEESLTRPSAHSTLAWQRRLTGLTVVADLTAVAGALVAIGVVELSSAAPATVTLIGVGLVWLLLLLLNRSYDASPDLGLRHQAPSVLRAGAEFGLLCWIVPTLVEVNASTSSLILLTGALVTSAVLARIAVNRWSARAVAAAGGVPLVVAGEAEDVARAVSELNRVGARRWKVVAARVSDSPVGVEINAPVTVGLDDLTDAVVASGAEAVLLLPSRQLDPIRVRRLTWQLEATGARLYVGTGLLDAAPGRTRMLTLGDLDLVHLRPAPMRGVARAAKVVLERLAVVLLLLLLAVPFALIALAVRLDSPGQVLFRQRRIGRDGRDFTMLKFRTMVVGAESGVTDLADLNESVGPVLFKIRQDPRLTGVGGFLRRYSLDEIPQLLNVLLGSMSLVGPRPALPEEVAAYELDPRRRLAVLPGMTGLWQVSGRSDLSWEDTVRLDLHYVDNWSLGLDAAIMCRTVRAVLSHRGAY